MRKFFDRWEAISSKFKLNIIFPITTLVLLLSTVVMGYMLLSESQPDAPIEHIPAMAIVNDDDESANIEPEPEPPEPRIYLALGDSVTSGFGVDAEERYTALFYAMLKEADLANKYINKGVVGITTTVLLELLHSMDEYDISLIYKAEVITLNIGGNNILLPLLKHLPDIEDITGIITELRDFIFEARDTVAEAVDLAFEVQEILDNWDWWRVWMLPQMNRMIDRVALMLDDVIDVYSAATELELVTLFPLLLGTFPPELEIALQSGVEIFAREFREILEWIEKHAPDAIIIINTIYNPIPPQILEISLDISNAANALILSMNRIITQESNARGHLVADVYAVFENVETNIMNVGLDASAMVLSFDIIHPNADGHYLIAALNYGKLREAFS